MALARKDGMDVIERNIEPYDVINADEAFYTSTAFSMMACTKFEGSPIGDGKMGPLTKRLLDNWSHDVGVDIVSQTKAFGKDVTQLAHLAVTPYRFGQNPV
jgi:branched-chain amino acid aminotransferase